MAADLKTVALSNELKVPTVTTTVAVRRTLGTLRPALMQVSEQVSKYQQLLAGAEGEESDLHYSQKFESLVQSCRALQKQHGKADEVLHALARLLADFEIEAADFVTHVEEVRG